MHTIRSRFFLHVLAAASCSVSVRAQSTPHTTPIDARDRTLWASFVTPYLAGSPWHDTGRYNAAHLLMVPLHAAFSLRVSPWEKEFVDHFNRFIGSSPPDTFSADQELSWLQYDYLASQYLVLATARKVAVTPGLADFLGRTLQKTWSNRPAWQWDRRPFAGGMRERILWKLTTPVVAKSYYRAIIDQEQYVFAIAADLNRFDELTQSRHPWSPVISDILSIARQTYKQRVAWRSDGGWLFQPGIWADHRDFLYAGRQEKRQGLRPAPLTDVAEDASHSFRRPLWLQSLKHGAPNAADAAYYDSLLTGLDYQFFAHVLVPPSHGFPAYRTKNWMDGRNGIFRWMYMNRGTTWGYGPYELSGSFTLGWWVFLDSPRIRKAYAEEATKYPLPIEVLRVYEPNTAPGNLISASNKRHELFRELIVRLASKL